jgi:hypothetical protein
MTPCQPLQAIIAVGLCEVAGACALALSAKSN